MLKENKCIAINTGDKEEMFLFSGDPPNIKRSLSHKDSISFLLYPPYHVLCAARCKGKLAHWEAGLWVKGITGLLQQSKLVINESRVRCKMLHMGFQTIYSEICDERPYSNMNPLHNNTQYLLTIWCLTPIKSGWLGGHAVW